MTVTANAALQSKHKKRIIQHRRQGRTTTFADTAKKLLLAQKRILLLEQILWIEQKGISPWECLISSTGQESRLPSL